jgi:hypothetical protein
MARYPGRKAAVLISTSGTGVASVMIAISQWSCDETTDKIPVTAFQDPNKTYVQGLPDIKGSFSGFWDDTESKLDTAASSNDGCKLYFYPDFSNAPSKYKCGPAWVDQSMSVGVDGAVQITANFVANGSWANSTI